MTTTFITDEPLLFDLVSHLARLHATIEAAFKRLGDHMSALDDSITALSEKVTALTTVDESAISLINGISGEIQLAVEDALSAGASTAQLQSLSDLATKLDAENGRLASAVAANTPAPAQPAQPAPEPAPAPTDGTQPSA